MMGGPAPVRRFLPHLIDLVLQRKIGPGKVFDLTLPLADFAEGLRFICGGQAGSGILTPVG